MKKPLNYKFLIFLFLLCIAIGIIGMWSLYTEMEANKTKLNQELASLLEQVAKENGIVKNKNTPITGQYNSYPNQFGTYETRTFKSLDTTFTFQRKIVDIETERSNENQFFLLLTDQLYSKDIQLLLDSILNKYHIKAETAVGIYSSGYPAKQLSWSNDTLNMNIDGCTQFTMDHNFVKIHYTACVDYAFATLWNQADKSNIYLWGFIELTLLTSLLFVWKVKRKKTFIPEKEEEVETIKKSIAIPIKNIRRSCFSLDKNLIVCGEKSIRMYPQSSKILHMFLAEKEYRVSKNKIKKIWASSSSKSSNMTTAINRINKKFEEIECNLEIITDPKDREFYLLQPTVNQGVDNPTKTSE